MAPSSSSLGKLMQFTGNQLFTAHKMRKRYEITIPSRLQPPRYRFHPSLIQYRLPSSPSRRINFSQRPSLPEPITKMVWSFCQPMTPLGGRPKDEPSPGADGDPGTASSPISKCALENEYTSENTRGMRGNLLRIPHFWFEPSSAADAGDWLGRPM